MMRRRAGGWTAELDDILAEVYPAKGSKAAAEATGRSYSAVLHRVHLLRLSHGRRGKRPVGTTLTERLETAVAAAGAAGVTASELIARFAEDKSRSIRSILSILVREGKAFTAGHQRSRRWFSSVEAVSAYDLSARPRYTREQRDAERHARKQDALERQAQRQAQRAAASSRYAERFWTDDQLAYLHQHYPTEGALGVAPAIGRTHTSVTAKALKLGIKCDIAAQRRYLAPTRPDRPKREKVERAPKPAAARPPCAAKANTVATRTQKTACDLGLIPAPPKVKKPAGPALSCGPVSYHPDFKFTHIPTPPAPLRTNTYPVY